MGVGGNWHVASTLIARAGGDGMDADALLQPHPLQRALSADGLRGFLSYSTARGIARLGSSRHDLEGRERESATSAPAR
eukprot:17680-Chlamydomonas_euryale.AAC.4